MVKNIGEYKQVADNFCCYLVNDVAPGNAILGKFRNALLGRANPLQDADSFSDRATLQQSVAQELLLQFNVCTHQM